MKYLDLAQLESINNLFSYLSDESRVRTPIYHDTISDFAEDTDSQPTQFGVFGLPRFQMKVEAYSCKITQNDKKLLRYLEARFSSDERDTMSADDAEKAQAQSPEPVKFLRKRSASNIESAENDSLHIKNGETISRRVLFYLIGTLNASFPDYDFRYQIWPQSIFHYFVTQQHTH